MRPFVVITRRYINSYKVSGFVGVHTTINKTRKYRLYYLDYNNTFVSI
nr:MAG TPA: hypothetical protein [Caudoviricetes sp.]